MTLRIGANPIGWSNDDLRDIGGDISLETCLAQAKEAGFEGMELGHKFPREPQALKAALAPFGMACVGGWHSVELLQRDAAAEFANAAAHRALLKAMGTPVFIVAETSNAIHGNRAIPLSQRPRLDASAWRVFTQRLDDLAKRLRDDGFALCYHHHMGTVVETREDIDHLMDHTSDAVHLLLDTGHATWAGSDPAGLAATYRTRISHVHAKDVRAPMIDVARARDLSFLDAVLGPFDEPGIYTVPGDGCVDYVAVLRALKPYEGWIVVEAEQDPKKADPLTFARKGAHNLRRFIADAGL